MKLADAYQRQIRAYRIASGGDRTRQLAKLRKIALRALKSDIRRKTVRA